MSDEQSSGQIITQPRTPPQGYGTWNEYWTKVHNQPWRTEPEIDAERQQFLAKQRAGHPDTGKGIFPFAGIEPKLTRADIEWLLVTHRSGDTGGPVRWEGVEPLAREGLDLRGADLRGANLIGLPLARMLGGLYFVDWMSLPSDSRERAAVRLEGADLTFADLAGATLRGAHLEGTRLYRTNFEGAILHAAHLEGKRQIVEQMGTSTATGAQPLPPANLQSAFFDAKGTLREVSLGNDDLGFVSLADVRWGGVNLAVVNWKSVHRLGDERIARQRRTSSGERKSRFVRLSEFETALRANRQVATILREQGLNDDADRFAYRAQLCQRVVLRRRHRYLRYLGSVFLWLIAGYGYRPLRSFVAYLLVVGAFAVTYYLLGNNVHPPLDPLGAVVFSITSFHGRGFAPGENVAITNPLTVLAAGEAIIGLLIEITFIATFTQRFFAR